MKNIPPLVPTLDSLIRHSLAALAPDESPDDDIRIRFNTAFDRIRRFYQSTNAAIYQSIVEPGAAVIETNRRRLSCPRLFVQCMTPATPFTRALIIAYVPDAIDRIALDIVHSDTIYRTSQFFQWTQETSWCSANGDDLDGNVHANTVRQALYESDLFKADSMELVPLDAAGDVN